MKPPARQERAGPGRLNKFGGPNLFTLDTVKWGRAKAREAPHLTGSSAAWATGTTGATSESKNIESKIRVENRTKAGNTGFGITTLSFSPTRVTVSFGARRDMETKRLVEKDAKPNRNDLIVITGAGGFIAGNLVK